MRLDKWLKVSRIIKRRTMAQAFCDAGRVWLNGRVAKSAHEVRVGDRVVVRLSRKELEAEVLVVPTGNVSAQAAASLYQVLAERPREPMALPIDDGPAGAEEAEDTDANVY